MTYELNKSNIKASVQYKIMHNSQLVRCCCVCNNAAGYIVNTPNTPSMCTALDTMSVNNTPYALPGGLFCTSPRMEIGPNRSSMVLLNGDPGVSRSRGSGAIVCERSFGVFRLHIRQLKVALLATRAPYGVKNSSWNLANVVSLPLCPESTWALAIANFVTG